MELIVRTLADSATYRRLVYLVSALALGPVWFTALVTVWSLCLGLAITPFVIPVLITARNSVYRDDPMGFLVPAFTFAATAGAVVSVGA